MADKFYNIWYVPDMRWTNAIKATTVHGKPKALTWEQVNDLLSGPNWGSDFEIRELLSNGSPGVPQKTNPNDSQSSNQKTCVEVKKTPAKDDRQEEINFFSAVASGNCPCNVLRSECRFHKD